MPRRPWLGGDVMTETVTVEFRDRFVDPRLPSARRHRGPTTPTWSALFQGLTRPRESPGVLEVAPSPRTSARDTGAAPFAGEHARVLAPYSPRARAYCAKMRSDKSASGGCKGWVGGTPAMRGSKSPRGRPRRLIIAIRDTAPRLVISLARVRVYVLRGNAGLATRRDDHAALKQGGGSSGCPEVAATVLVPSSSAGAAQMIDPWFRRPDGTYVAAMWSRNGQPLML
jgi:hypothetical protein